MPISKSKDVPRGSEKEGREKRAGSSLIKLSTVKCKAEVLKAAREKRFIIRGTPIRL